MLEIASEGTGHIDIGEKRQFYEALQIPEYWRFDATGEFHGTRLAGDRLVQGRYEPIAIEEVGDEVLQGHSTVLNLNCRWEQGRLAWYDPATGRHIATFESMRARAVAAEAREDVQRARVDTERTGRLNAEAQTDAERARADTERAGRLNAEVQADAQRTRADRAEAQADAERAQTDAERTGRLNAEARADAERAQTDAERAGRLDAEAQVRELQEEIRRLRGG